MVRRPLCFVLAALISGIYIRYTFSRSPVLGCCLCVLVAFALYVLTATGGKADRRNNRRVFLCALAAAAAGILLLQVAMWEAALDPVASKAGQTVAVEGVILSSEPYYKNSEEKNADNLAGSRMILREEDGTRLLVYWRGASAEEGETLEGRWLQGSGAVELPSPARNPGGFDEALYLKGKRIHAKVQLESGMRGAVVSKWRYVLARRRTAFLNALTPFVKGENKALLGAMLFGDKSGMPDDLYMSFQRNGTAHVLAVSGLHVGMVYALYRWLLGRRQTAFGRLMLGGLLFCYAALAGFSPSVVRASVMIGVHTAGSTLHARYDMLTGTLTAAALILMVSPYQLFAAGFQLSFMAVLLLAFLQPFCEKRLLPGLAARRRKRGASLASVASTAAAGRWLLPLFLMQAGMLPLTVYLFQYVSPFAFAVNLPLVFLASLLVPGGIALLAVLNLPGGMLFLPLGGKCLSKVLSLLLLWNRITYMDGALSFDVASPPLPVLCLFYTALFFLLSEYAAVLLVRRRFRLFCMAGLLLFAAALTGAAGLANGFSQADVIFVDVGQGDCVHLRGAQHTNILIDGGGRENYDVGGRIVKPYLLKNGVRCIDIAMVTHLDTDHYAGIVSLCRCGMVDRLVVYEGHSGELDEIRQQTGLSDSAITFAGAGDTISAGGIRLTICGPLHPADSENEQSLVVLAETEGKRILITGDIGASTEEELNDRYREKGLLCDVMQVPHHGSRYSSSEALLKTAAPSMAVVQVGRNNYGHPAPETLARYEAAGIMVFRNDLNGAVGIDCKDGRVIRMIHPAEQPAE